MEILYLLIPLSIALVFVIGAIFWWALSNRKFEGLEEEGRRIFLDDDVPTSPTTSSIDKP